MVDIFSAAKRSEIMSRIRSTGTRPEDVLFAIVEDTIRGVQLVRNPSQVIGTPDIYIPELQLAFFLDGCFFHGCPWHGHIPKTNEEYWRRKIERNVRRDRRLRRQLRQQGSSVWRIWEHDVKTKRGRMRAKKTVELALSRCKAYS